MTTESRLLNEHESAAYAGVTLDTIRDYQRIGILRAYTTETGTLFATKDLEELFQVATTPKENVSPASNDNANAAASQNVTYSAPGESNSFELVEINKSLKEQIEVLRQERDWLRMRVEKMEERSNRDQILLLSQSKNARLLITKPKSSGLWSALALPFKR